MNAKRNSKKAADWLTAAYDYKSPHHGEILRGILLDLDEEGALIDVGLKTLVSG